MSKKTFLTLLLLIIIDCKAYAKKFHPIDLDRISTISLGKGAYTFQGKLDPKKIDWESFSPNKGSSIYLSSNKHENQWVLFRLKSDRNRRVLLSFEDTILAKFKLYKLNSKQALELLYQSSNQQRAQNIKRYNSFGDIVSLTIKSKEDSLFLLKVSNNLLPSLIKATIWNNESSLLLNRSQRNIFYTLCFTTLIIVAFFSFFSFLINQNSYLLLYTVSIGLTLLWHAWIRGMIASEEHFVRQMIGSLTSLSFATFLWYFTAFHDRGKPSRLFLLLSSIIVGVNLVTASIFTQYIVFTNTLANIAVSTMILVNAINLKNHKKKSSIFEGMGWLVILLTQMILLFTLFGLIEVDELTWNMNLLGFTLGLLINSIGFIQASYTYLKNKSHNYSLIKQVIYPHQFNLVQHGYLIEKTMPTFKSQGIIIQFNIIKSSGIFHPDMSRFVNQVIHRCLSSVEQNYNGQRLEANGFNIKYLGHGFICSIGYPFETPLNQKAEDLAVKLAIDFLNEYKNSSKDYDLQKPPSCTIGIVRGSLQGYYPKTGVKHYEVFGQGITTSNQYSKIAEELLGSNRTESVILLQDSVFQSLNYSLKGKFTELTLSVHGETTYYFNESLDRTNHKDLAS